MSKSSKSSRSSPSKSQHQSPSPKSKSNSHPNQGQSHIIYQHSKYLTINYFNIINIQKNYASMSPICPRELPTPS
ncbi:unnamed protein product [Paramecium octaurelia]|uniref:Uncharacterized protein n=1 Tax=Paramecium octaurelia TaxID=43137 RepID=A0A8S1WP64_PAROT|nr:unnamed protein product [Paramecium octaurelia]